MTVQKAGREPAQVVVSSEAGLTQEITSGNHHLRADEPVEFGGADLGPSPYDLLLASLGACTSMTLRMYAKQKEWDLGRITIRLQHHRIYAEDCMDCENKQGWLDRIVREIEVGGNLADEQKKRLHAIAESCPIHRTLRSAVDIQTIVI